MSTDASTPDLPSESALASIPEDERLAQAAQAAKVAATAQGFADTLRSKASLITDPAERSKLLNSAYENEVRANGMSRKARFLKSGTFQGAAGGAGIGGVVGMGLGTVVGTVVGGVVSLPTTVVGGLVGSGVGMAHGPFVKLGGGGKNGKDGKDGKGKEEVVQVPQEAIDGGAVSVDEKTGQVTAKDPEALKEAAAAAEQAAKVSAEENKGAQDEKRADSAHPEAAARTGEVKSKKKPRKLEVRSGSKTKQSTG